MTTARPAASLIVFERLICPPSYANPLFDSNLCCNKSDCVVFQPSDPDTTPDVVVIPPNSNLTIVGGLSTLSIVIQGLGSTITIEGCDTESLKSVTVELSAQDIEKISSEKNGVLFKSLLTGPDCPTGLNLGSIPVYLKTNLKDCRQIKVQKASSAGRTKLDVLFVIDRSKCNKTSNLWWIILASVLGVVVLAVVVAIVLIMTLVVNPKRNSKLGSN